MQHYNVLDCSSASVSWGSVIIYFYCHSIHPTTEELVQMQVIQRNILLIYIGPTGWPRKKVAKLCSYYNKFVYCQPIFIIFGTCTVGN